MFVVFAGKKQPKHDGKMPETWKNSSQKLGRPQKLFQRGQARYFAYLLHVADDTMPMHVHKTLCPFYTIMKMSSATHGHNEGCKGAQFPCAKWLWGRHKVPTCHKYILQYSSPVATGGFSGLIPPNKAPSPLQIETWNTINKRSFGQFHNFKPPPNKRKAPSQNCNVPLLKTFCRRFCNRLQYICFRKISGSNIGAPTYFLPWAPSNLVTPLLLRQQSQKSRFVGAAMLLFHSCFFSHCTVQNYEAYHY